MQVRTRSVNAARRMIESFRSNESRTSLPGAVNPGDHLAHTSTLRLPLPRQQEQQQ